MCSTQDLTPHGFVRRSSGNLSRSAFHSNPKVSKSRPDPNVCFLESRFGSVAVVWSYCRLRPKICRIFLSRPGVSAEEAVGAAFPGWLESSCAEIDRTVEQMAAFLSGGDIHFSLDPVRLDLCSAFQQGVLRAEHGIPRGYVSTYRQIARHLGKPNGARAVGSTLARNPFPIIITCHRAIRSDRTLGGYQGGTEMKRVLLEMEGIDFDGSGRALTPKVFY